MDNLVGEQFGNYRLTKKLGGGGFGYVYLAENIYTHHLVAVKIPNEKVPSRAEELFLDEARTIAQFDHPHIARLHDFGVKGNTPYLIIEYAKQGSLRDRHQRGTQVNLATVIVYVKQIAEALQYAHNRKTTHRDVKPDNFLMKDEGEILLTDFGIAIDSYSWRHMLQIPAGSVYYMAPEQTHGKAGSASDQYSLAITIYEWLCGTVPFKGTRAEIERQHESASPLPLHTYISIAPSVEEAVLKALAKEPAQRFQSVQEFSQTFEQAYQEQMSSLLKQSELTVDMLRQDHLQQMLLDLIITNPKWWNDAGRAKIASLHMQAHAKPSLSQSIKGALNSLAAKAVDQVVASIERKDWEGCDNLLDLISEAVPPSADPNIWISLLESLSTKPKTMQALLGNWKIHSWLLEHWGSSSLSTGNKHIRSWFPTTWPELWPFLRLTLPEEWYDVALTHLLDTTATPSLPPSVVRSIERDHHSALENYMRRSFSSYPYRITTVRLFAKLVESDYAKKMELLSILLSASDIPQIERLTYMEKVLPGANLLTQGEIAVVLEQQWSQLKSYSHLPKVLDYIGLYLLVFTLKDLDRSSARQLLQFLHANSSISLPQKIHTLAESWFTINAFLEQPTISKMRLVPLASAIKQLPPAIHAPLLDKLSKPFIACINSEADLLCVTEAMSTVLKDPELLGFLYRLAELVGEEYRQKRTETSLVPYIQIALQAATVFQIMSNAEQDEFMIQFLDLLLQYADLQTYKKLKIITQNWPTQLSVKWLSYETAHNFPPKVKPPQSGGILQLFHSSKVKVGSGLGLFILSFSLVDVFYFALFYRRASEWIFWLTLLLFNGVVGILAGGKRNVWWRIWLVVYLVNALGYATTVLFSATIGKTCLPLWIVAICPLPSIQRSDFLLILGVGMVGGLIGVAMTPLSKFLPALLRTALSVLILLSTIIGILIYGSYVTPYPAYLPGHGSPALYDPLQNSGSSYGWEEYANADGSSCKFTNGAYHVNAPSGYYIPCYAKATDFGNFAFEVDMKITDGDCGGIILRGNENTYRLYFFIVCQGGGYALFKYVDNVGSDSATLTNSNGPAVKTGLGQSNRLAVVADGNSITLYINRQQIAQVYDNSYTEGQIALFAQAQSSATEVTFNNATTWIF